jgi:hypothetical protein
MHIDLCAVRKQNVHRNKVDIHFGHMENIQQCYPERRPSSVFYHDLYCPDSDSLQLALGCKDINSFPEWYIRAVQLSIGGKVLRCAGVEDPMVRVAFLAGLIT